VNTKTVWSDEQRALILEEMDRLLADPAFKSSKRCHSMLVRLVEYALTGDSHGLKERILGVEVFGRDPNYDSNNDPIVRTTATEIRKRLAQWYQDPNNPHSVRIHLVPGSYLPEFEFDHHDQPKETAEEKAAQEKAVEAAAALSVLSLPAPPSRRPTRDDKKGLAQVGFVERGNPTDDRRCFRAYSVPCNAIQGTHDLAAVSGHHKTVDPEHCRYRFPGWLKGYGRLSLAGHRKRDRIARSATGCFTEYIWQSFSRHAVS